MADTNTTERELKKGGNTSKATLQSYIQNFSKEAIDTIVYIMQTSRNENLKMGAAKVIIDKSIPDIKAIELGGVNGEPIKLFLSTGSGFTPRSVAALASSDRSHAEGQPQIQGLSLPSESKENNNSNTRVSEASTS